MSDLKRHPRIAPALWASLTEREQLFALTPETPFQAQVEATARQYGWRAYHVVDSRFTPKGWPDMHAMRERPIVAELKAVWGTVSEAQADYLASFVEAGHEIYVWTPLQWDEIHVVLGHEPWAWTTEGG